MIRTGDDYRESIRDGREVWIDGERVHDVTTHPAFKPIVDVRARIYDMAHESPLMRYVDDETGELCATGNKPPRTKEDWYAKRAAVDAVLDEAAGIVTRVGDETVGEMWSLADGEDVLNEVDPQFGKNIAAAIRERRDAPRNASACIADGDSATTAFLACRRPRSSAAVYRSSTDSSAGGFTTSAPTRRSARERK